MQLEAINWHELSADAQASALQRPTQADEAARNATVAAIIDAVRNDGDSALQRYTQEFDKATLSDFAVSDTEVQAAEKALTPATLAAIDMAISNVRAFHSAQLPAPLSVQTVSGVTCERMSHPLDAVGLYVPAGTAPLPSAAIMLAVPAALAGCPTRILCTPPRPDGSADPAVLVAAQRAGVRDIYKVGGAQAIAAMAYGTASIPKVNKLFGPGNAWVTAAKTMVAAQPGGAAIDMPAGPSEVLVIADAAASAKFVAADLLSQAEHGTDSQVILITTSAELAADVIVELGEQVERLSRRAIAVEALEHARLLVVDTLAAAIEISNQYAPEHLILQIENARQSLPNIRNAGSVFLGPWAPESVGDYCSGTNHVLPTNGYATAYSGLGVDQFLRQMTVQELTKEGLGNLAETVVELANLEGLDAHAAAVKIRMEAS